jgi:hypothetical protein
MMASIFFTAPKLEPALQMASTTVFPLLLPLLLLLLSFYLPRVAHSDDEWNDESPRLGWRPARQANSK